MAFDHRFVGAFEMAREPRSIEERMRLTIAREPLPDLIELRGIMGKLERTRLVILERMHDHIRETNRTQQTRGHTSGKTVTEAGQNRQPRPERVRCPRMCTIRERVEKQICVA